MKEELCIGIVEDEALTAETISIHLKRMGHRVLGTYTNYDAVFAQPNALLPDLYLIDIRLKGTKTGLDIAQELQARRGPPFLFLTSNSYPQTVQQAMATLPMAYITKPFSYEDLFIGVELAKAKLRIRTRTGRKVEFKNGGLVESVLVDEIHFLEADRSYVRMHTDTRSMVLRQALGNFLLAFEAGEMVRVHRSYAVNPAKVNGVAGHKIMVGEIEIPLGRAYKECFENILSQLKA